jgi:hypothetical protein
MKNKIVTKRSEIKKWRKQLVCSKWLLMIKNVACEITLKFARRGLYSTAALCIADCALAPNDVVPFFISRGATTPSGVGALY